MNKTILLMTMLMLTTPLTGCLERIEPIIAGEAGECAVLEPGRTPDGTLRILTYDIAAFSDEMLAEFTNQTGFEIEMILTDDSGGILEQLMQTQQAQQADLTIGLDNTYLQTAINFCLLQAHSTNVSGLSETALALYSGPLALPFDRGDVCLNYDETRVDGTNLTVPTSLWNLTEPEWKGLTAFPSPVTSSPGRAFMAATIDYFEMDEAVCEIKVTATKDRNRCCPEQHPSDVPGRGKGLRVTYVWEPPRGIDVHEDCLPDRPLQNSEECVPDIVRYSSSSGHTPWRKLALRPVQYVQRDMPESGVADSQQQVHSEAPHHPVCRPCFRGGEVPRKDEPVKQSER